MALNDSFMQPPDYYLQAYNAQHPDAPLESFMDQNGRKGYRQVGQKQAGPTVTVPNNIPSSNIGPGNPNLTFDPSKIKFSSSPTSPVGAPSVGLLGGLGGALGAGAAIAKAFTKDKKGNSPAGDAVNFLKRQFGDDDKVELPPVGDDGAGFVSNAAAAASPSDTSTSSDPLADINIPPFLSGSGSDPVDITGSSGSDGSDNSGIDTTGDLADSEVQPTLPQDTASAGSDATEPGTIDTDQVDTSGLAGIDAGDVSTAADLASSGIGIGQGLANGDALAAAKSLPYVGSFIGIGDDLSSGDYLAAAKDVPYLGNAVSVGDDLASGDYGDAAVSAVELAAMSNPYTAAALGIAKGVEAIVDGSVICTELHDQGIMPDYMFEADGRYGDYIKRYDPYVLVGYHVWAKPIVKLMRKYRIVTKIMSKVALPWGEEMAYQMHARDKGNLFGRCLIVIGMPICRLIGKMKGLK